MKLQLKCCFQDDNGNTVEVCCCRLGPGSCSSSYCGKNPKLLPAKPTEMNIVCSEHSLQIEPEQSSPEQEIVLHIKDIVNHPSYEQGTENDKGPNLKGPYAGADIAVYHLNDESKQLAKKQMSEKGGLLHPACLPKKEYSSERGIFAGWLDQEPFYRAGTNNIEAYEKEYLYMKRTEVHR